MLCAAPREPWERRMTDFVLSAGNTIRPHRSPWGAFPVRHYPISTDIASNQIFIGSLVGLDQTAGSTSFQGSLTKIGTSSGMIFPAASQIVGIAAENPTANLSPNVGGAITSTTAGSMPVIPVWEANPNVEFKAWTRWGLLTSTIAGSARELVRDSTLNIDLVNLVASSLATPPKFLIVTGLIDNSGDSGGGGGVRLQPHCRGPRVCLVL